MSGDGERLRARPGVLWAPFVRSSSFIRKELVEVVRQPRLVGLLVLGPFMLLVLFGVGYSQSDLTVRVLFVATDEAIYEEALDRYQQQLDDVVDSQGFVATLDEGHEALEVGQADVIVEFPVDPVGTVLSGEHAVIRVIHDEIDPIQQTAIWVVTRLAVQEINAAVVSSAAGNLQDRVGPADEILQRVNLLVDEVEQMSDPEAAAAARDSLDEELAVLSVVIDGTAAMVDRLDQQNQTLGELETLSEALRELSAELPAAGEPLVLPERFTAALDELTEQFEVATRIDPEVLVSPFEASIETFLAQVVEPDEFYTPSSLALLLQHVGVTFASLSLVRDRTTGLYELLRVGPLSPAEIIIGKCVAYLLIGATVAAALLMASIMILGIPMAGDLWWLVAMVAGVITASLALGMLLSLLSRTESQAVQFAMLSLLAGLFFSGFVLSIDDLTYPVRVISWLLPVTFGIRSFQDVMFRGIAPRLSDIIGLASLTLVYGAIAIATLRRQLSLR